MDSEEFCREGNIFADLESLSLNVNVIPRQHEMSLGDHVQTRTWAPVLHLYKPLVLSLPSNDDLRSLLASLSIQLTNRYLVTRIIQYSKGHGSGNMAYLYSVAKPFVWYQDESAGSVSGDRSGDEL